MKTSTSWEIPSRKHLGMEMDGPHSRSEISDCHYKSDAPERGWSQPNLDSQSSWNKILKRIMTGDRNPNGSYVDSKNILKIRGFNLRKSITNSSQLQERIDNERVTCRTNFLWDAWFGWVIHKVNPWKHSEAALWRTEGTWCAMECSSRPDCLDVTDVAHMARELKPTKRQIVSLVGRFYIW